jgi:hypothetical protein
LGRVRIQPVATPGSYFEKPGDAADSQLGQLADALSKVSGEVAAFGIQNLEKRVAKIRPQESKRPAICTRVACRTAKQSSRARSRPISPPGFARALRSRWGKQSAERFNSDMIVAFAKSPYAESYDPKDFDKFANEYMTTWAAENLPDTRTQAFNTGFATVGDKIAGARDSFAARAGENLIKYNRDSFGATVYAALNRIQAAHGSDSDMAAEVQHSLDLQVAAGMDPRVANDIAAEAIIRLSGDMKQPLLMQSIMSQVKAGPTSLLDRPTVGLAVKEASEHMYDRRMQEDNAERQRSTEVDRIATDGIMSAATAAIRANPATVDLDPYIKQLEKQRNPESNTAQLLNLKRTYAGEKFAGDQMVANELLSYAVTVTDEADPNFVSRDTAAKALIAKRINQEDFNNVISLIERRENEDHGKVAKVLRDPVFTMYTGLLKSQFGSELTMPGEARLGMMRAVSEQTAEYLHWRDNEGKSASDEQKLAFLKNLTEQKRVKFGGQFKDMKNALTEGMPQADVTSDKPEWQRGPVKDVSQNDWLQISFDYMRGGNSIDSLSNDQINKLMKAGATPETLSEFIKVQLQFNGISVVKPAAATKR